MTEPLIIRVRNALSKVEMGQSGRNIVALGAVQGLHADHDGKIRFTLEAGGVSRPEAEAVLSKAKDAAAAVEGVSAVSAIATAHREPGNTPKTAASGHDNPLGLRQSAPAEEILPQVKAIVAIASGKGGVGKSTMAANIAVALARAGHRTGFLDADIYGPSAPTLFGVSGKAEMIDGKIAPAKAHGVSFMSIGLMVDPEQALAWRGPMVMGALKQMMRDVAWGELDVLIVDTPPGTGDAHLSLIQTKRLAGAVIVSTPQEMALADVRRGVQLFRKTGVPILGVIENMAWLQLPDGEKQYLFGEGGAQKAARDLGAPFLGAAPLYPELREASDAGTPLAAGDHPAAEQFAEIAKKIADAIGF